MEKIWYILINGQKEGPYSLLDLRRDERITPDTLVWKKGYKDWVPIRKVLELHQLFEDKKDEDQEQEETERIKKKVEESDVLALRAGPPYQYIWIIIAVLLIIYAIYQFFEVLKI